MNKLSKKVKDFIVFAVQYKVMNMLKRKTDDELKDLYRQYSPAYYSKNGEFFDKIVGIIVIYCVGNTLKQRHSTNLRLQEWDFSEPYNL